jgi:DNA-binding NarL/FixJ family response regulator
VTKAIRILVADDHALFRSGLRALFASVADAEVVGEAATGEEAAEKAARLSPEVVLMDLQMPGTNGIEATRRILNESPGVGVVMVTMFEDDDSVFAAMRAGARGYVLKGADQDEILKVIRAVAEGDAHFGPAIADRLYLSPKTVRNHISNVFLKLQVADRAQAIVRAREAGLGQDKT